MGEDKSGWVQKAGGRLVSFYPFDDCKLCWSGYMYVLAHRWKDGEELDLNQTETQMEETWTSPGACGPSD